MQIRKITSIATCRKAVSLIVVAALSMVSVIGCGLQEPATTSDSPDGNSGSAAAPAAFNIFGDEQPESAVVPASAETTAETGRKHENRLAHETSPYLLMHARNPVDWYPWGPEAFEAARTGDKPIFLSIGYSSCYWCHVMERLVFENEEIARYMNEHFINIKVDREERPDIDDIYMTALQIYIQLSGSGGGGGWPLSMFLTPDGKPIAGGTYFPPADIDGRTGFPTLTKRIIEAWTTQRASLEQGAETITQYLQKEMLPGFSLEKVELTRELAESVSLSIVQSHDPEFGGVDFQMDNPDSPKFPVPTKLALLQYEAEQHDNATARRVLYHTLDAMAAGGIRDHLAGGFHRYSTDRQWLVPHFEKMLYDNAQLANIYIDAARATNKAEYRQVAEEILSFIMSDMTDSTGAFHSAIDAETDGIEGKYYVWSREEVQKALGDQTVFFGRAYGLNLAATSFTFKARRVARATAQSTQPAGATDQRRQDSDQLERADDQGVCECRGQFFEAEISNCSRQRPDVHSDKHAGQRRPVAANLARWNSEASSLPRRLRFPGRSHAGNAFRHARRQMAHRRSAIDRRSDSHVL